MNVLVIVPTFNEAQNVGPLLARLQRVDERLDYLFVDDNSPDGTGTVLDRLALQTKGMNVLHRTSKEGIGSAHMAGLDWAVRNGYQTVITMDCDATHSPEDIPSFLKAAEGADVVIGSRYMAEGSIAGWHIIRRFITNLGHALTRAFLGISYDCTGAFRLYRLDRIPAGLFETVRSKTYPFFFESLFLLHNNGAKIVEIPIHLPPRASGSSKMPLIEPFRGLHHLIGMALDRFIRPEVLRVPKSKIQPCVGVQDMAGWDAYWERSGNTNSLVYQTIATVYRRLVITRRLEQNIREVFTRGATVLHEGCGSGHVDVHNQDYLRITALDASTEALGLYSRNVPRADSIVHASVFHLPFGNGTYDGAYHLGVIEHFSEEEIISFLHETRRVLKPDGKLLIFWPNQKGTSVAVLRVWHALLRTFKTNSPPLHPPEISLLRDRKWAAELLNKGGFALDSYCFDYRDFWVQSVITASPLRDTSEMS
jgi:dolichol-phosphate mannosyltransferase